MGKANFYWSARDNAWILKGNAGEELVRFGETIRFASGKTLDISGPTLTATSRILKDDFASSVYTIEHITIHVSSPDNETIGIGRVWSDGTVVGVTYWTSAAIGSSAGIDVLDGGTDGTGTDVIDACSNNLSGFDINTLTTPHALSAGDVLLLKFDDFTTAPDDLVVDILIKVPISTAT